MNPAMNLDSSHQDADQLLQAGIAASQAHDSEQALALFARASAACPQSGVPHLLAGAEHAALGCFDQAEAAFAKAVLLAPGLDVARYQLGLLQFSGGRVGVALVSWQPLFALDDALALGHFVRGYAALAQDDLAKARAHFVRGLACHADNAPLASDIQKVVHAIDSLQGDAPVPAPTLTQDAAAQLPAQMLLANYGKFGGTLH